MASKVQAALSQERVEDMEFELQKSHYIGSTDDGDGVRLVIKDVPVVNVDWHVIERILTDAGLDGTDAMYVTEHAANKLHELTVGKLFARRAKRIG